MIRTVVFDLDGTLIDSAPSIVSSLQRAFDRTGLRPRRTIGAELIGPPLSETVEALMPDGSEAKLGEVISAFKACYDEQECTKARPFGGVVEMLTELRARGLKTCIATNKRLLPTRKIVNHLGWDTWFEEVLAPDSFTPAMKSKTQLLARMLTLQMVANDSCVYVGDRNEDYAAASANSLPCLLVSWGYGSEQTANRISVPTTVHSPTGILDAIAALKN